MMSMHQRCVIPPFVQIGLACIRVVKETLFYHVHSALRSHRLGYINYCSLIHGGNEQITTNLTDILSIQRYAILFNRVLMFGLRA